MAGKKNPTIEGINDKLITQSLNVLAQGKTPDTFKQNTAKTPDTGMYWCALQFLTDTTVAEIQERGSATTALALAYKAGAIIYGQFNSCTGDGTGTVRAYYYLPL